MKKISVYLLFVVLAGNASAESAVAPPPAPASLLSFSFTPSLSFPFGDNGTLGDLATSLPFGAPNPGGTISCLYRSSSSPLYLGADLGYSYMTLYDMEEKWSGNLSMLLAGLNAGLHLNILPTLGLRCFGSAGYSYNFVQPRVSKNDTFHNFLRLDRSTAHGGTPFVGAGAELSWTFVPALSLVAGARLRHFLDLFTDMTATLGISCNFQVGGSRAVKSPVQRAVPLKKAANSRPQARPPGAMIEKLSQFLIPGEPTLYSLSCQINSLVGQNINRAVDKNLQSAIGFHEALRLMDISCIPGPLESSTIADSVKSPLQTVRDRSGDYWDLSILYCALLQSVQVETAFITTPGHVFMAFALASSEEEARETFSHAEEFIFRDGKAWVPIEVTEREGSFLTAWQAGAKEWREARKQAHFYPVGAFGNAHEPVNFPGTSSQALVVKNSQQEVARLVDWEIQEREAALLAAVSTSSGSPEALNALGVLYARWDLLEKAEVQFQAAVQRGDYAPALVNLGNLRLLGNLPEKALSFYQRAAAVAPYDPAVLLGLARSNCELQNYELVKQEYDDLQRQSPQLAEQFSYLRLQGEEVARAAEANHWKDIVVWGEEE